MSRIVSCICTNVVVFCYLQEDENPNHYYKCMLNGSTTTVISLNNLQKVIEIYNHGKASENREAMLISLDLAKTYLKTLQAKASAQNTEEIHALKIEKMTGVVVRFYSCINQIRRIPNIDWPFQKAMISFYWIMDVFKDYENKDELRGFIEEILDGLKIAKESLFLHESFKAQYKFHSKYRVYAQLPPLSNLPYADFFVMNGVKSKFFLTCGEAYDVNEKQDVPAPSQMQDVSASGSKKQDVSASGSKKEAANIDISKKTIHTTEKFLSALINSNVLTSVWGTFPAALFLNMMQNFIKKYNHFDITNATRFGLDLRVFSVNKCAVVKRATRKGRVYLIHYGMLRRDLLEMKAYDSEIML